MKNDFQASIRKFRLKSTERAANVQKAAILELFKSVILDTPVDEGRARANWQATIGSPAQGQLDAFDKDGSIAIGVATQVVNAAQPDSTLYLANNLPYIEALEFGHSKQSPLGMVRRNLTRLERLIQKHIRKTRGTG